MPRDLPWKIKKNPDFSTQKQVVSTASTLRQDTRPADKRKASGSTSRAKLPRHNRTPSTSPPPEPVQEEFMIHGINNDDMYRMVEDEFLDAAKDFTQHLHAAEYQRLKKEARSKTAEAISSISRPVTGARTDNVMRSQAEVEIAVKQRAALAQVEDGGRNDEDRKPRENTSLRGLMDSPRKKGLTLTGLISTRGSQLTAPTPSKSKTNVQSNVAAKMTSDQRKDRMSGSMRHARDRDSSTESDEDDDDLTTVPAFRPSTRVEPGPIYSTMTTKTLVVDRSSDHGVRSQGSIVAHEDDHDENDGSDSDIFTSLRRRRQERGKRSELLSDTSKDKVKKSESQGVHLNEIPFF